MNKCCTIDNVQTSSGDGTGACKVNCLVCLTCGLQQTFVYKEVNDLNLRFSIARSVQDRLAQGLPVFSEEQARKNL